MKHSTKLLTFLLCCCFSYSLFADNLMVNPYSPKVAKAETIEQETSEKNDEENELMSTNYEYETDSIENALLECGEHLLDSTIPLANNIVSISSTETVIKNEILSKDQFSIDATVYENGSFYAANDYYDFSKYSKYDIAEWAYDISAITEEEKIEYYCDLIISRNFDKVDCLSCYIGQIQSYSAENELNLELSNKIDYVLNPMHFNSDDSIVTTASITTEASYTNDYFTIYYDASVDTYAEAKAVGDYFNEVRNQFINMGFRTPLLENNRTTLRVYLEPGSGGSAAASTHYYVRSSTNVSESWMYYYNFTELNDDLRQRIAHEYFHAIQNAYNYDSNKNETAWFKEATANWAKFVITGSISTANSLINTYITSQVSSTPLPETSGYGAVVFPLVMHKKFGGTNVIKAIYEEYNTYGTGLQMSDLRDIISAGMASCGHNGGFDYAYRSMVGFLYNPNVWYRETGYVADWGAPSKTIKNISSENGSMTFEVDVAYLTSQYFQVEIPSDSVCMIEVSATFSNSNGRLEQYRKQQEGHNIFYPGTNSNKASFVDSSVSRFVIYSGFILSNLGDSEDVKCTVTIKLTSQDEHFTFYGTNTHWMNSKYAERRTYLIEGEYADYTITFATAGTKLIQTFGTLDTELKLYNSSGTLIDSSDDEGYDTNALLSFYVSANSTYRVRVKFHKSTTVGWVRLAITPAFAVREADVDSMSKYEDIKNFTGTSLSWYSYAQNNYTRVITFTPTTTGTYTIELESVFDNYLYVIDPRSSEKIVSNVDYNDDGGGNGQAKITRTLEKNVPYLIIYSQWNLSAPFTNLDEGDDLRVKISKN